MDKVIARPWLSLQCRMIPGVRHAVFAADEAADGAFATLETWPEDTDAPAEVLATLRAAIASEGVEVREPKPQADAANEAGWVIACPLRRKSAVCGAVAVAVGGLTASQVPVVTQLLQWGSAWPAFLADQEEARRHRQKDPALSVLAAVLEPEDFRAATAAAATALAHALKATRAAIGFQNKRGMRVAALSGRAIFDRRSDRLRRIEAAMNEACDQDSTVVWPAALGTPAHVTEAHSRLSAGTDDSYVCTVPLRAHGTSSGALTLVRPRSLGFGAAEIDRIEGLTALVGPALEARRRADRGAFTRAFDTGLQLAERLFGAGHLRLKTGVAAAALLLAFLTLASGTHEVSAVAVLQGTVERELVAPVDGFVAEAHVRAGTRVRAGDVLATLDEQSLQLERRRWESQRDELTNEYHQALGALDRGATRVLQAQVAQAEAQLALVESELERARITAPFDGLIVSGDLSQSLGSPVSRGDPLFRLAPLDGYRVILEVEEGDVPSMRAGITGRLALAALPGERFKVRVERVNGMAKTIDGRNVLEVEGGLENSSGQLRPGMKGVARLEVGRARLIWIWTHGLVDRLRLWLWAWSPLA